MSISSNYGDSEKSAATWKNEEETEVNLTSSDEVKKIELPFGETQNHCCKNYKKILSPTPTMKVSERDILIATLQEQVTSMENLYKKTVEEQQNITKKYSESVQKLSKGKIVQKMELTKVKKADVISQQLRTQIINRLEVSKIKPKKCCKYLYEVLGVEIPGKKTKGKGNKQKNSKTFTASVLKVESKENQEYKKELTMANPEFNSTNKLTAREHSLQKELIIQVADMEKQEGELCVLQNKLKNLSESTEYFEHSMMWANKLQSKSKSLDEIFPKNGLGRKEKYKEEKTDDLAEEANAKENTWKEPEVKISGDFGGLIKIIATKYTSEMFPNYDKYLHDQNVLQNRLVVEEKGEENSTDKKEKRKSSYCSCKKNKSLEISSDTTKSLKKSEEEIYCHIQSCPFQTVHSKRDDVSREETFLPRCQCFLLKEKNSTSTGISLHHRRNESEEDVRCSSNWKATKSLEILCCHLKTCGSKLDAAGSTHQSCHEECPEKNGTKLNVKEYKREDPDPNLQTEIIVTLRNDDMTKDLKEQLKEIITKTKILLSKFGCQLEELRRAYENAQKEVLLLRKHEEELSRKLLACVSDNAESIKKEELRTAHQLSLSEKTDMEEIVRRKEIDLENKFQQSQKNELFEKEPKAIVSEELEKILQNVDERILKSVDSQSQEKLELSEHENDLLRKEIADLKSTVNKSNQAKEDLKSCKRDCDAVIDKCREQCEKILEESKHKVQEVLEEVENLRQEKHDLEERKHEEISTLKNQIETLKLAAQETDVLLSQELTKTRNDLENLRRLKKKELLEKHEEIRLLQNALEIKSREFEETSEEAKACYETQIEDLRCCLETQKCCYDDALKEAKTVGVLLGKNLENLRAERTSLNEHVTMWTRKYEDDLLHVEEELSKTREELQGANEKLADNEEQLKNIARDYDCKLHDVINNYELARKELREIKDNERKLNDQLVRRLEQLEKAKLEVLECQRERDENQKLRSELNAKQKCVEEELEQTKHDKVIIEKEMNRIISDYSELVNAQELTTSELVSARKEAKLMSEENEALRTRLKEKGGDLNVAEIKVATLTKELEDLKADMELKNENLVASYNVKIEKLAADYQEAQAVVQSLNKLLNEINAEAKVALEKEQRYEDETVEVQEYRTKCDVECQRHCVESATEAKTFQSKKEECRKFCAALKKSAQTRPIKKQSADICDELASIKKMLSDIEFVPDEVPSNGKRRRSFDFADNDANSWKEEYKKTVLERDALKQEMSEMYNKLKGVMEELENKFDV